MPIYEYQCKKCQLVIEEFHGANEKIQKKCESCRGELKRVFSPTGIVFKGSGFHITDYGKSSHRDHSTSKAAAKSTPESKPTSEAKSSFETKSKLEWRRGDSNP